MISIGCLTYKRLSGEPLPPREWSLGRYGLAINVAALCWLLPIFIFTMFPSATPTTAAGMNVSTSLLANVGTMAVVETVVMIREIEKKRELTFWCLVGMPAFWIHGVILVWVLFGEGKAQLHLAERKA